MTPAIDSPVYDAATVARLLGFSHTAVKLAAFGPPPDPLDGFVTFFDPGLSIISLRVGLKKQDLFWPQNWYDREPFALATDSPRYRQVRMGPIRGSLYRTYAEQVALLHPEEEVPAARVVVTALVVRYLGTGLRLLKGIYVRCSDLTLRSVRVYVANNDSVSLGAYDDWDENRHGLLWLASSRKVL